MAALLTLLAIVCGVVLGRAYGGNIDNLKSYRPHLWQALAGGIALQLLIVVGGLDGGWAVGVELISSVALLCFAVANIRLGGMVLVVAGLALNLIPTLFDWGIPTSRDALVTAGIVEDSDRGEIRLEGPRHVATDADTFTWIGETIALPTGQVISPGDALLQFGYLLVTASLLRGRVLRHTGGNSYRSTIAPLGRGPAPRRGPGLHPTRLDPRGLGTRRTRQPHIRVEDRADEGYDDADELDEFDD